MATKGIELGLALVLVVAMLCTRAMGQSACSTAVLVNLSPCLSYITGNSSTPSSSCCSQLARSVQSQPQCLCSLINGTGAPLGIPINQTLALALPNACNLQTPPVSQCNAPAKGPTTSATTPVSPPTASPTTPVGSPTPTPRAAPTASPADSSNQTPSSPEDSTNKAPVVPAPQPSSSPSGTGSKTVPSKNTKSSAGTKSPINFVLLFIFLVTCSSTVTRF